MMNILLLYPRVPETFYAMKHFIDVFGKKASYPPLGLLTIAPLLPTEWSKRLVDMNVTALHEKDLEWADFVFFSAMNVQVESVMEVVQRCKRAGVKMVAGGPLFTHEYERFPDIDYFVLNEAEITLPLFLEDLTRNTLQPIYKTTEFADITKSPLPAFELVNMDHYFFSIVQYSRGCPHMCDFCDVTALFGKRPRIKSTAQVIQELEAINLQNDIQLVLFADDNLIGNVRVLKNELLPALIAWRKKRKPRFFFTTQLTINLADDQELMALLLEAGFRNIFIGIETLNDDSLKGAGKRQNLKRDQLADIHKLHQAGFIVSGGFIVGFDTDTPSIFQQQIDFIQQSGIPLPIVNLLKAPPGTVLFEKMEKEGRISKPFAFLEGDTNIVPVMDEKLLHDGFLELIAYVYNPEKSYQRIIHFLNTYRFPKTTVKVPEKYTIKDLFRAFRILYLIGIKDQNRIFLWKLLLWSIKNSRKKFTLAFLYGVMICQIHQTYLQLKNR